MVFFLAALLALAGPAAAEGKAAEAAPTDETTIKLVEYFLKTPPSQANPKLIEPFLAVKTESLPKKLRDKAAAKQVQINALLRIHDTKKAGFIVQPLEGCSAKDFVKPLSQSRFFYDYEEVTEDELKYVEDKTKCAEIDLGCRFSLLIFYEKKKERVLKFAATDPIMAIVAETRSKAGSTKFFGVGFSCMR